METSTELKDLATALSKAQAKIIGAVKDSNNPFYKSKYADLATVWDAVRGPLTENGLSLTQFPSAAPEGSVALTTMLMHSSGQWVRETITMKPKENTPQAIGSALTYCRRYAIAAVTGCPQIDDDGEAAMARHNPQLVHDPRPDTSAVNPERIAKVIQVFDAIKSKDLDEDGECLEIWDMHNELRLEPALYSAVADELASTKRISREKWKAAVKRGTELANRSAA